MVADARVFSSKREMLRYQKALDLREGYPRRGVNGRTGKPVGPETFTPGAFGWQEHAVAFEKHPTRDEWAISDSEVTRKYEGAGDLDDGSGGKVRLERAQVVKRDNSWTRGEP